MFLFVLLVLMLFSRYRIVLFLLRSEFKLTRPKKSFLPTKFFDLAKSNINNEDASFSTSSCGNADALSALLYVSLQYSYYTFTIAKCPIGCKVDIQ